MSSNLIPSAIPSHEYRQWGFAVAEKAANAALVAHCAMISWFSIRPVPPAFAGQSPSFSAGDCRVGFCQHMQRLKGKLASDSHFAVGNLSLQVGEQFALAGPVERQLSVADMTDLQPCRLPAVEDLRHEIGRQKSDRQYLAYVGLG